MIARGREYHDRRCARGALRAVVAGLIFAVAALISLPGEALALKAIVVGPDQGRLEITTLGELYEGRGDSLQVETAAGEDGVVGPHVGRRGDAGHQSQLDRVRAHEPDRQAGGALALGGPLQRRRLRRGVARSRRTAHRGRDAVDRLRAGAHQERPRRRVPHHARAGADHHVRGRAFVRAVRTHLSLEAARLRAQDLGPPAFQRRHARAHWPHGDLPDRHLRSQPQAGVSGRRRSSPGACSPTSASTSASSTSCSR